MSDLYARLGVAKDASPDEIKRAYRKEALTKHPDRGGKKEEFQGLQEAYDVLSDPNRRSHYDMTGQVPQGGDSPGFSGMPDLSSLFGSMFASGMPFFGQGPGFPGFHGGPGSSGGLKAARGPNKIHEIGVSLSDLYKGKRFTLNMTRDTICGGCKGKGGSRTESCESCGGRGFRVRAQQMGPITTMSQEACGTCRQMGQRVVDKCGTCKGKCVVEKESALEVVIEPGMQEGDRITFVGKCSESPMFETPGDVMLVIRAATTDSESWVRSGEDLTYSVTVTLAESLLGWARQIDAHPSGRPLHIVWNGGVIRDGEVLRIDGWGMPRRGGSECGVLRIVCRVEAVQGAWSEDQLRALKEVWADWVEPNSTEDSVFASRS